VSFFRRSVRLLSPPMLLAIGLILLIGSWIGANAPGEAPDEPANYVKAVGAGHGQFYGTSTTLKNPSFPPKQGEAQRIAWIQRNTRAFRIPAGLNPEPLTCTDEQYRLTLPTTCSKDVPQPQPATTWSSYVGTYQPYVYAVAGFFMNRMSGSISALYMGRVIIALICAAFIALAVAASWDRRAGPISLAGVAIAASPMVLFLGSALGANGVEIASALCLFAVVLRGARPDPPAWLWAVGSAAAAATILARPTGLAWLVLAAALAVFRHGPRSLLTALLRPGKRRIAIAVTVLGIAAAVAWDETLQPHPKLDLGLAWRSLHHWPKEITRLGKEWIGVFGWATVPMNRLVYALVLTLVALLVIAALIAAPSLRERLLVLGALASAVVITLAMDALVFQQTYFPVYGRYLLPIGMLVPLVSADTVTRFRSRLPAAALRIGAPVILVAMSLVQLTGVWTSARRSAVGVDGPRWFFSAAKWAPPGGWWWVAILAAAGAACAIAAAIGGEQRRVPESEPRPAVNASV
jgi:Predicted membrane protein (DUF2142)